MMTHDKVVLRAHGGIGADHQPCSPVMPDGPLRVCSCNILLHDRCVLRTCMRLQAVPKETFSMQKCAISRKELYLLLIDKEIKNFKVNF